MKFECERYPELVIHDLGVTFVDGEAEVETRIAAELRKLPIELGIHTAKSSDEGSLPRRSSSSRYWHIETRLMRHATSD